METIQASYTGIFCWWSSDAAWSKGLISTERVCNGGKVGLEDMLSKVSSLFLSSPEKINYWIRLYLSEVLLMKLSFFENLYALLRLLLRPLSEWLSVNWVFCVIITGSSKTYWIQISLRKCYIYFFFFTFFGTEFTATKLSNVLSATSLRYPDFGEQETFLQCSWFQVEEAANCACLCLSFAPPLGRCELMGDFGRTG